MKLWVYLAEGMGRHSRTVAKRFHPKVKVWAGEYMEYSDLKEFLESNILKKNSPFKSSSKLLIKRKRNLKLGLCPKTVGDYAQTSLQKRRDKSILAYHQRALDYLSSLNVRDNHFQERSTGYDMYWGPDYGNALSENAAWCRIRQNVDKLQLTFCRFNQGTQTGISSQFMKIIKPPQAKNSREERVIPWAAAEGSCYLRFLEIGKGNLKPVSGRIHIILAVTNDTANFLIPCILSNLKSVGMLGMRLSSAILYPPLTVLDADGYEPSFVDVIKRKKNLTNHMQTYLDASKLIGLLGRNLKLLAHITPAIREYAYQDRTLYDHSKGQLPSKFIHRETHGNPAQHDWGTVRLVFASK